MQEGSFVRHRGAPEWGVGRIVRISGDDIQIEFKGRTKTLKLAVASQHLEEVTQAEVGDRANQPRAQARLAPDPARKVPCITCAKPLNEPQRRDEDRWQSCPECSVRGGREHIFRRFPDAFGEAASGETATGGTEPDSRCTACRTGGKHEPPIRTCSRFPGA